MDASSDREPGLDLSYSDYLFVAEYYDFVVPYRSRDDINFYREQAGLHGGPVLEMGCGTGRVLIPIARSGIKVTGVDLSAHMLKVCRRRLAQESQEVQAQVELIQGDMAQVKLDRLFNLVTCPFRAFQHVLSVEAQIESLVNAYKHLQPGGTLVIDVFNPSLHSLTEDNIGVEFGEEPEFTTPDGKRVVRTHRIMDRDLSNQIISVEIIYNVTHPDGKTERLVHEFKMRYFFRFEMEHLLTRCGYKIQKVYSDFERRPFGEVYPGELIFIAQKVG